MNDILTVLVPLDPQEQKSSADSEGYQRLRQSVWGTVSHFLQREMGTWFTGFQPAAGLMGISVCDSFGVVLGEKTPNLFAMLYATANALQSKTLKACTESLLKESESLSKIDLGSAVVLTQKLDGNNRAARAHLTWLSNFTSGKLVPGCGVYHCGFDCAQLSEKMQLDIVGEVEKYALCVVELHLRDLKKETDENVDAEKSEPQI